MGDYNQNFASQVHSYANELEDKLAKLEQRFDIVTSISNNL